MPSLRWQVLQLPWLSVLAMLQMPVQQVVLLVQLPVVAVQVDWHWPPVHAC